MQWKPRKDNDSAGNTQPDFVNIKSIGLYLCYLMSKNIKRQKQSTQKVAESNGVKNIYSDLRFIIWKGQETSGKQS